MANSVEMLSGRKKKDYAAESAADALAAQAAALGYAPESVSAFSDSADAADDEELDEDEAIASADEEELVAA